jgi:hypothetical protein
MKSIFTIGYRHPRESVAKAGVQGQCRVLAVLDPRFRGNGDQGR